MEQNNGAAPQHWRFTPYNRIYFAAEYLTTEEVTKAFDDVYYRILPDYRLPPNCEIQLKCYQTEEDEENENYIAIYHKTENRQRSRANAEPWAFQVLEEDEYDAEDSYIWRADFSVDEESEALSLDMDYYRPLPRCWEYNTYNNLVLFNGSGLTLTDAAHCFDEGLRRVPRYHRDEILYWQWSLRIEAYEDENDPGYRDPLASIFRMVEDDAWQWDDPISEFFDRDDFYYNDLSVISETGHDVLFRGLPDTAFDFDEEDDEDDEEWEDDFMSDEESHVNVTDIAMGGALLHLMLV